MKKKLEFFVHAENLSKNFYRKIFFSIKYIFDNIYSIGEAPHLKKNK